ncbi:hypothetical protein [Microbulbifer aestuariivivens]
MEIYYRKARWLGFIFIIPAFWLSLSVTGYSSISIKGSEAIAAYAVIGLCFLIALQCFMGSTRFYFDNKAKAGIQVRKHFYGEKIVYFPYSNITGITILCYRRVDTGITRYCVGISESAKIFGQNAVKFIELRSFGGTEDDRSNAREFAKQIGSYTKLSLTDNSDIIRAEAGPSDHA